jgi:hypothetical protein
LQHPDYARSWTMKDPLKNMFHPPSCDNGNSFLGISLFLDMEKEKSLFGSNEHFVL